MPPPSLREFQGRKNCAPGPAVSPCWRMRLGCGCDHRVFLFRCAETGAELCGLCRHRFSPVAQRTGGFPWTQPCGKEIDRRAPWTRAKAPLVPLWARHQRGFCNLSCPAGAACRTGRLVIFFRHLRPAPEKNDGTGPKPASPSYPPGVLWQVKVHETDLQEMFNGCFHGAVITFFQVKPSLT